MAAYIKFDGIDGESKDKDHAKWCDLVSIQQTIHKPGGSGTGVSRRRGDAVLEDIRITKLLDKASPKLAEKMSKGEVISKVEIQFTASYAGSGRTPYMKYELSKVSVTSQHLSIQGQSEQVPSEDLSLNFEEIKVTYIPFKDDGKPDGNVEYSWKVEEGK